MKTNTTTTTTATVLQTVRPSTPWVVGLEKPTSDEDEGKRLKRTTKLTDEYEAIQDLPPTLVAQIGAAAAARIPGSKKHKTNAGPILPAPATVPQETDGPKTSEENLSLVVAAGQDIATLVRKRLQKPKAKWHPPWKLMRVISGHLGWVRSIAVDPTNQWFATGSGDRTIKIWDMASGTLKLSLTGHIGSVQGLVVSDRHPYLFSVGDDKLVKCWDLEVNKVIRHYHGHLSGVYTVDLHPTLDILVTGGRDAAARVWDIRSQQSIHVLTGHTNTISSVKTQAVDPQIITSSMDQSIRMWDLAAGKSLTTLTHHKKSVRDIVLHPREFSFASCSPDNIKQWKFPEGEFIQNLSNHRAVVNTLSVNEDDVLFSGGDNGSMCFWDWKSGHCFQEMNTIVQPGSLDAESGIFASAFDRSGARLITCEADKTIKIWKEDETVAPPETYRED